MCRVSSGVCCVDAPRAIIKRGNNQSRYGLWWKTSTDWKPAALGVSQAIKSSSLRNKSGASLWLKLTPPQSPGKPQIFIVLPCVYEGSIVRDICLPHMPVPEAPSCPLSWAGHESVLLHALQTCSHFNLDMKEARQNTSWSTAVGSSA